MAMGRTPWNKGLTKESNLCIKKVAKNRIGWKHSEEAKYRMSLAHLGKHISPATEFKPLNRPEHHRRLTETLRRKIIERDNNSCQGCGGADRLAVHHKNRNPENNRASNLTTLCISCHAVEHYPERLEIRLGGISNSL